jgi:hypothetical protein
VKGQGRDRLLAFRWFRDSKKCVNFYFLTKLILTCGTSWYRGVQSEFQRLLWCNKWGSVTYVISSVPIGVQNFVLIAPRICRQTYAPDHVPSKRRACPWFGPRAGRPSVYNPRGPQRGGYMSTARMDTRHCGRLSRSSICQHLSLGVSFVKWPWWWWELTKFDSWLLSDPA